MGRYNARMTATAPEAHPAGPGSQPPGRRERKKQQTRDALIDAAFRLFADKGFDATTVEEIADAVDISSRTFFRYFASKEDVALTFQDEQMRAATAALAARPADEPIMTALHRTVVDIARACEAGELGFDPEQFACMMNMTAQSTALLAGSLEHAQKKQAALTRVIAERMGLDASRDLRPHIIASVTSAAIRSAAEACRTETMPYTLLSEAADEAFTILESGLNSSAPGQAG